MIQIRRWPLCNYLERFKLLACAYRDKKFVRREGDSFDNLHFTGGELAEVTIVITTHFHVKDFSLSDLRVRNKYIQQKVENVLTYSI